MKILFRIIYLFLKKGLRGMHLQIKSKAQSKLLKVMKGKIFDVCVDLRIRSKHLRYLF